MLPTAKEEALVIDKAYYHRIKWEELEFLASSKENYYYKSIEGVMNY